MTDNMKKVLKICPKCRSSNIHKRARILFGSVNKKGRWVKKSIDRCGATRTKCYKCYTCKHEFDTPIILESLLEPILE